jgi:hypothetical protein
MPCERCALHGRSQNHRCIRYLGKSGGNRRPQNTLDLDLANATVGTRGSIAH